MTTKKFPHGLRNAVFKITDAEIIGSHLWSQLCGHVNSSSRSSRSPVYKSRILYETLLGYLRPVSKM